MNATLPPGITDRPIFLRSSAGYILRNLYTHRIRARYMYSWMGVVAMTRVVKSNWQVMMVKIASRMIATVGIPRLSTLRMIRGNMWSSAMTKNAREPCAM